MSLNFRFRLYACLFSSSQLNFCWSLFSIRDLSVVLDIYENCLDRKCYFPDIALYFTTIFSWCSQFYSISLILFTSQFFDYFNMFPLRLFICLSVTPSLWMFSLKSECFTCFVRETPIVIFSKMRIYYCASFLIQFISCQLSTFNYFMSLLTLIKS